MLTGKGSRRRLIADGMDPGAADELLHFAMYLRAKGGGEHRPFREWRKTAPPIRDDGEWVPSGECSPLEIAEARACNRWHVDPDGLGWVLRSTPTPEPEEASNG